jgi:hypothetical protein
VRLAPKFWDATTLASLRRRIGANSTGTDLLFEALSDGSLLRAIHLVDSPDYVLDWDIDPSRTKVVFAVRSATGFATVSLDLTSGEREEVPIQGDMPKWVP